MKPFLLFAMCALLTGSVIAQSSIHTPYRPSFTFSPNHVLEETNELFNTLTDPFLALDANPANARFFRTGKTLISASWQSEQRESISQDLHSCRTCTLGFFYIWGPPPPITQSMPELRPQLGLSVIHHLPAMRMSPVVGFDVQHYSFKTGFLNVPVFDNPSLLGTSTAIHPTEDNSSHVRSGLILSGFLSLELSERWDAGLKLRVGTFKSDGYLTSLLQNQSVVVGDASQHELTAGLTRRSAHSSASVSYSYASGQDDLFETAQTPSIRRWVEYDAQSRHARHTAFGQLSTELSPTQTFTWMARARQSSGPMSGIDQSQVHTVRTYPPSSSTVYYESNDIRRKKLDGDASETAIETGIGLVQRHSRWTMTVGMFTGQRTYRVSRTIESSGMSNSKQVYRNRDGIEIYSERSDEFNRKSTFRSYERINYFQLPFLADIPFQSGLTMLLGAEMDVQLYKKEKIDSDVLTRFWIGTRVSPTEHWNLTLRTQNIQKNSFSHYALRDMQSVMVSVMYSR